jgi:hypothetical protein
MGPWIQGLAENDDASMLYVHGWGVLLSCSPTNVGFLSSACTDVATVSENRLLSHTRLEKLMI